MTRSRRGFTLIELLVTLAIIRRAGLLRSFRSPSSRSRGRRSENCAPALREIRGALDEYKRAFDEGRIAKKADESGYPPSLDVLVQGMTNEKDPKKAKIYFLRRIPRDPFSIDPATPPASTWGERSYASPPDAPAAGNDVFDVYSLSEGVGLNGIPYRQW